MTREPTMVDPAVVDRLRNSVDTELATGWAAELVRIDSQNPPGDETEAVRWLADRMDELGLEGIRTFEPEPRRRSVSGRLRGSDGTGRALLWNGHLDVVPVGDEDCWTHPPFAGVVEDGRLWGRGSSDMKAAVAALLAAVAGLRAAGVRLGGDLIVQGVADEEALGPLGTKAVLDHGDDAADAAIVGEPTELEPVVAARGLLWGEVTVRGRSCHASVPHLGVNAITAATAVVANIDSSLPDLTHPLLPGPTLSVSTIEGGTKTNIVPDTCSFTFDRRMLPGETFDDVRAQVQLVLDDVVPDDAQAELRSLVEAAPSEVPADHAIVTSVQRARTLLGMGDGKVGGLPGTTDARLLCATGIPALVLGPGSLDQAHSVDEYVAVDQIESAALLYAVLLCDFLGIAPQ